MNGLFTFCSVCCKQCVLNASILHVDGVFGIIKKGFKDVYYFKYDMFSSDQILIKI